MSALVAIFTLVACSAVGAFVGAAIADRAMNLRIRRIVQEELAASHTSRGGLSVVSSEAAGAD